MKRQPWQAYKAAAALGFKGNVSDFIRAACDDLAARLTATEKELKVERTAFLHAVADPLAAHLERDKPPAEPPKGKGNGREPADRNRGASV
jgi:hypothetical protein